MESGPIAIRRLENVEQAEIDGLARVLIDCVEGGASVSFMHPLPPAKALAYWQGVADGVQRGERALLVAQGADGHIVGTVQLVLAQPDNQPHRADLAKMLVHRSARRRGVGDALLRAAEDAARDSGKTLLVLDTASPDARRLYERLGWVQCGTVPDYALLPQGGYCDTTFYFRRIAAGDGRAAGFE